jgi:hypothetical protein
MSGSVLVAKVRRDLKVVELDGTVRPGASIDAGPKTEVVILAMSQVGHLVDAAAALARDLRVRGWQVTVQPYRFCGLEAASGIPATASAMVRAVETTAVLQQAGTARQRVMRNPRHMRRWRCDGCDEVRFAAGLAIHQKKAGHAGRTYVGTVVYPPASGI